MRTALQIAIAALVLLAGSQIMAQTPGTTKPAPKKKKGDPVPAFDGRVVVALHAEIVPDDQASEARKTKTKVTLSQIREALKDLKMFSDVKAGPGTRRFSVALKGTYADADRVRLALKKIKIICDIVSPARIVLQPLRRVSDYGKLVKAIQGLPGVGAAGKGRGWGVPDPSVGIISAGAVLDARPVVSADRKYVTLTTQAGNSKLNALLGISINVAIAFADLDKVSLEVLQKTAGEFNVATRVPSHKELRFTFEEAGSVEKAREALSKEKGVLWFEIDPERMTAVVRGAKSMSRFRVARALKKNKFRKVKEVE